MHSMCAGLTSELDISGRTPRLFRLINGFTALRSNLNCHILSNLETVQSFRKGSAGNFGICMSV